jgi:hypothetical protein
MPDKLGAMPGADRASADRGVVGYAAYVLRLPAMRRHHPTATLVSCLPAPRRSGWPPRSGRISFCGLASELDCHGYTRASRQDGCFQIPRSRQIRRPAEMSGGTPPVLTVCHTRADAGLGGIPPVNLFRISKPSAERTVVLSARALVPRPWRRVPAEGAAARAARPPAFRAILGHRPGHAARRPEAIHSLWSTGCSAAWLARVLWVHEVAGSSPASPTGYCCCFSGNGVPGSSSATWNRYAVARLRYGRHGSAICSTSCWLGRWPS